MHQTNPRFQETTHASFANPQGSNPLTTPSTTEPSQPTHLQAQPTSPIEDLAARVADLQARQASLEAQQTQQVTPTTPSPTAQQMVATPQPSQPSPQQARQGLPQRLRSMVGLSPRRQQPEAQPGQRRQLGPSPSPGTQVGPTMHAGREQRPPQVQPQLQQPSQRQPEPYQPYQGQQSQFGPQVSPFQRQAAGQVSPTSGMGSQPGQQGLGRRVRQPPVDILDEGENLVLEIELPGARKEDIRLRSQQNALQLRAQTRERREEENLIQSERGQVLYQRSIPLGVEVDSEQIEASFEDGILRVRAPKRDPTSGPRNIEID